MKIKTLLSLSAGLITSIYSNSFAHTNRLADTVSAVTQSKYLRPVKIGPAEYFPPVPPKVDSALLRKLAIDKRYQAKTNEELTIKNFQDIQLLHTLLSETETFTEPDKKTIGSMEQLLASYQFAGDLKNQTLLLNTFALYYAGKGDLEKAAGYYTQSLMLCEKLKDKPAVSKIAMNLGNIYKLSGKYDEAITFNEYAIRINSALKKNTLVAMAYLNIASLKALQEKYTEAEFYVLRKALPLFHGNKAGRMNSFISLASVYNCQNRYSEAKWYYLQARQLADFLNDTRIQVSSLVSLAEIKCTLGDQDQALSDFKEAEIIASQNKYIATLVEIKGNVGEIYHKSGDYAAATTAINEYSQLRESLFNSGK